MLDELFPEALSIVAASMPQPAVVEAADILNVSVPAAETIATNVIDTMPLVPVPIEGNVISDDENTIVPFHSLAVILAAALNGVPTVTRASTSHFPVAIVMPGPS